MSEYSDASLARAARQLVRNTSAKLTGRERGPDREVRRNSYDVEDPRAKPWQRMGDGSIGAGIAHVEAILATADELRHQQWREQPAAAIRDLRHERDALQAELAAHAEAPADQLPIGRPAAIRLRLKAIEPELERFDRRIRRIDVMVLRALLKHIDFATGRLYPTLERIAQVAGCHRNSVIAALRRLKAHGFVDWVRRSVSTNRDGEFAPQREQTSSAYVCDPVRQLAGRVRERFVQLLTVKLRRLGGRPGSAPPGPTPPRRPRDPALASALDRIEASLANAST